VDIDVFTPVIDAEIHALLVFALDGVKSFDKLVKTERAGPRVENNLSPDGEQEHQESIVVFDPDTVVDPGAVMIEPFNTTVTDGTMTGTSRTDNFAFWTQVSWVNVSEQFKEVDVSLRFDDSGISAACKQEGEEYENGGSCISNLANVREFSLKHRQYDEQVQEENDREHGQEQSLSLMVALQRNQWHSHHQTFPVRLRTKLLSEVVDNIVFKAL